MAIQLPNPGLGDGQTGDNEFVMWTKVKDNFSNTTHAASRLVGIQKGQLLEVGTYGLGLADDRTNQGSMLRPKDVDKKGVYVAVEKADSSLDRLDLGNMVSTLYVGASSGPYVEQTLTRLTFRYGRAFLQQALPNQVVWQNAVEFYTSGNTTIDANKNIKTSSPIVRVFSDHLDKIHEANYLPIKYARNGVGDYTIEGTTGLRENDWQIVIPKDDHDNQLIAFTIKDEGGTIHLKTYKRTFNMTTFMFEPDLKTPLDIPDGRWVDLHFNDIPQEQLDEPIE